MTNKRQSKGETKHKHFRTKPIGFIRSDLRGREAAPRQGREGAPFIEVLPSFKKALYRMQVGDQIIVITWAASRSEERTESLSERRCIATAHGVFSTRSPDRPNQLGLHRVKVLKIGQGKLRVGRIEVIDETPVVDIKPVQPISADS